MCGNTQKTISLVISSWSADTFTLLFWYYFFNWICPVGTVQYMTTPSRGQLQEYHNTGVTLKAQVAVIIASGRVIDDNLTSQIKNRIFILAD